MEKNLKVTSVEIIAYILLLIVVPSLCDGFKKVIFSICKDLKTYASIFTPLVYLKNSVRSHLDKF